VAFFTALKVDRTWQLLVTIQRATGDARDFLIVDGGLAILDGGDGSAD